MIKKEEVVRSPKRRIVPWYTMSVSHKAYSHTRLIDVLLNGQPSRDGTVIPFITVLGDGLVVWPTWDADYRIGCYL